MDDKTDNKTENNAQAKPASETNQSSTNISEEAMVKRWFKRYDRAMVKFDDDFKRMKKNMEFVGNMQWDGQNKIEDVDERYITNITLRMVHQKTAQLYARNPTVEAKRRPRMDYQLWDGSVEMLMQAWQGHTMNQQIGFPADMMSEAVMADFMNGKNHEKMVKKICKTLEIVDQIEIDQAKPDYKEQMKQLVRRVVIAGVGYCRQCFVRDGGQDYPNTTEIPHSIKDRAKMLANIVQKLDDEKITEDDAEMETLHSLAASIGVSMQTGDEYEMNERVEYDFLPPTSVVPDERCRSLVGFTAARWLFIRYPGLTSDEINTMFMLEGDDQVKQNTNLMTETNANPGKQISPEAMDSGDPAASGKCLLIEVLNFQTKTRCFIVKGHKKYVSPPEPLYPCVSGFFPLEALTFNAIEVDDDCKASIFPLSDVDLIRDAQKEWNRTRDALRSQRNANAPTYVTRKGSLTQDDRDNIRNREPNEVIELEGVPSDKTPGQMIEVLQVAAIDPQVYATQPLEQDMLLTTGMQQANVGPAQPDVTATVGTIAEQSRNVGISSNVDDLDGFLSRLARARGEMRLQAMSPIAVQKVVGPGASWPMLNKADYINQIELSIKAGSSGRPNQQLQVSNRRILTPLLLQAGANPIAVIEDVVRVMGDDSIDVQEFFPIPGQFTPAHPEMPMGSPMGLPPNGQPPVGGPPRNPHQGNAGQRATQQPMQSLPNGAPLAPSSAV
jgi:hypothetical protein